MVKDVNFVEVFVGTKVEYSKAIDVAKFHNLQYG